MQAHIRYLSDKAEIICSGQWTFESISSIEKYIPNLIDQLKVGVHLNAQNIEKIDSAGAMLLFQLLHTMEKAGKPVKSSLFRSDCQLLLEMIQKQEADILQRFRLKKLPNWVSAVGRWSYQKISELFQFLMFLGEFCVTLKNVLLKPARLAWKSILVTIDQTGYQALAIVALLSFLVGIVVTYQIAQELSPYGADIYIIDVTGMIILREFGPLVTAIIATARTSTAFTAQIGTMKINEELDALATLGLPPFERLVVPKIIGLVIALPLLTVWADFFGIMGAMLTSKLKLSVGYLSYIDRFQEQIEIRHYWVGLVKAPVFAMLIAFVGCFQGFQVKMSANSVGDKTTKSAVQSIFLIIIADAIFSIAFGARGI